MKRWSTPMISLDWLRARDRGLAALRRAGRTALVMPALFALGEKTIGNPTIATFAAFGAFAMLLLVDFGGPMRERLQAHVVLAVVGSVFVCVATLASRSTWLAVPAMALVGFGVLFAGVASSVLASATTSLLLAFILPVSLAAPVSSIPDRLAGWGLAAGAAFFAIALLWPAPARDPLRRSAVAACRAVAARLRSDVFYVLGGRAASAVADHAAAMRQSSDAVAEMHRVFLSTPSRPAPTDEASQAAAASRRLDDTFRGYLAERGAKPVPLAEVTGLVTGAAGLRLAGDAVLDLWERDDASGGDRAAARRELLARSDRMVDWYDTFGASLTGEGEVPEPIEHDQVADRRLIDAVSNDLRREDGRASATAARMVWTGDHLDAARVLQGAIVGPARAASEQRTLAPRLLALPWFVQRSRHGPPHSPPPGHRPR